MSVDLLWLGLVDALLEDQLDFATRMCWRNGTDDCVTCQRHRDNLGAWRMTWWRNGGSTWTK